MFEKTFPISILLFVWIAFSSLAPSLANLEGECEKQHLGPKSAVSDVYPALVSVPPSRIEAPDRPFSSDGALL